MYRLAALLFVVMTTGTVSAQELAVLELRHRPAEEVAPLLIPLLNPGDTLVPHRNQLIIRTRLATLNEIRAVLEQLDRRPHRLRISVRQARQAAAEALQGAITGGPGGVRGYLGLHARQDRQQADQFVQTLDGQPAMIATGEAQPMAYGVGGGMAYQPITTGFVVTPRLIGQGVVQIGIEPWAGQLRRSGSISTQVATLHLQTPLGVWTEVGGMTQTQTRQGIGQDATGQRAMQIFVRVDDLDAGTE